MTMTDPIADMLTRIRNANMRSKKAVDVALSKMNKAIAEVLKREGFIKDFRIIEQKPQGWIRIYLKYGRQGEKVIHEIKRVSKPGRRIYRQLKDLERVREGIGIAIVSTSKGVMSDRECRRAHVSGEVICTVW